MAIIAAGALGTGCGSGDSGSLSTTAGTSLGDSDVASRLRGAPVIGPGERERRAILASVVQLLETAPLSPGGENIGIAAGNLNQYFRGTAPSSFALPDEARAFLEEELADAPFEVEDFETATFAVPDARHIEDCLLYHNIAARVAGAGEDLDRVRELFDWTVRHVQLIEVGSPIPPAGVERGLRHVPARPYDILIRGLASEQPGSEVWAERSWVFLSLCRQVGVDAAILAYDVQGRERPHAWLVAALIDGTPRLFDTRRGMAIPGPDETGIASLEQAAGDPELLDRLDLHAPEIPYETDAEDLGRVRVLLDSSRGYFAPKMRLLQRDLAGSNRMILHRDPAEQRDAWAGALGDRLRDVGLWVLPLTVEHRLFTDGNFVASTQYVNGFFDASSPLLGARHRQLRGDLAEAKRAYTRFRFKDALPGPDGELVPIEPLVKQSLDLYATYFLGLTQLEDGNDQQAIFFFEQALGLPPNRPVRGFQATLTLYGANANLAKLHDERGNVDEAIRYYARTNPTPQSVANLHRANELVFEGDLFESDAPPADDPSAGPSPGPGDASGADLTDGRPRRSGGSG